MTTLNLIPTRYVRCTDSGVIANTTWLGAMAQTFIELKTAPWRLAESDLSAASLPVNNPATFKSADDRYDAYRQSGNAAASQQVVYAGMACHTVKLPASAASTFVRAVQFRCNADKFAVGGIKVAAVLSDTETPPEEWELCRMGGTDSSIDAGNEFATPDTNHPDWGTIGILAETSKVRDGSVNRTGIFALDLSAETGAWKYLHLVISMFEESAWRYEYFVEGSGMIDPQSVAVTFDANGITPDAPTAPAPIEIPIAHALMFGAEYMNTMSVNARLGGTEPPSAATAIMHLSNGSPAKIDDITRCSSKVEVGLLESFVSAAVLGYSSVRTDRRITGVRFPFPVTRPQNFKFRLTAYFLNSPGLFGGAVSNRIDPAEYTDTALWLGRKTSIKFVAAPGDQERTVSCVCVFNAAIESGITPGDILGIDFIPSNPLLGMLFLLSPHSVTPPAAPSGPDSMVWVSSGISEGSILQEP